MKQLSVFIDESGDFGFGKGSSEFYLITLVFHEQAENLSILLQRLEEQLVYKGINNYPIHTGPIIKKKDKYADMSIDERKSIMYIFLNFIRKSPITYVTISAKKKDYNNKNKLISFLSRELNIFLINNLSYFQSFDQIIVYYDNGQQEIKNILNIIFGLLFNKVDMRIINPNNYRLFQVSDYICSIELLSIKYQNTILTTAEKKFFYLPQELPKQFIKTVRKKQFPE